MYQRLAIVTPLLAFFWMSAACASSRQSINPMPAAAMQVAPPVAVQSAAETTGSGSTIALSAHLPNVQSWAAAIPEGGRTFANEKELSVNFIGLASDLPSSSYFSSREVFIAEERLKRHSCPCISARRV